MYYFYFNHESKIRELNYQDLMYLRGKVHRVFYEVDVTAFCISFESKTYEYIYIYIINSHFDCYCNSRVE